MAEEDPGRAAAEAESLQLLLDSFVAITSEQDPGAILERAVDLARLSTRSRYGAAVVVGEHGIENFVHAGLTRAQVEAMPHRPRGLGMLGAVLEHKHPIRLDDLSTDPRSIGFPLGHVPMAAFLGVPIATAERVHGALYLTKPPGQGTFDERDELFMVSLANQTGVALESARLLREVRQTTQAVQLLREVAVAANEARSAEEALRVTLERICAFARWPVGHVYIHQQGVLIPSGIWHIEDDARFSLFRTVTEQTSFEPGVGLPGKVFVSGTPSWVADVTKDGDFVRARGVGDIGVRGGFAFPVLVGDEVVAVLEFYAPDVVRPDETLLALVADVGTQVGRVIERARLEQELKRLDAAKSEFIANAAHELRTPLTSVVGIADMLTARASIITPEQQQLGLEALSRQSARINSLVTNLLDLSQIDLGRLNVNLQAVNVAEAFRRVSQIAPPPEGVEIECVETNGLTAYADLHRLDQVLVNLVTNAYRYGGRHVRLEADHGDDFVLMAVADDGPGVPDELIPRLFEPFSRGEGAASRVGSGLGLAICARLAAAQGGALVYEPGSPSGARFGIRLKRA